MKRVENVNQDFLEFIKLLESKQVRYLVVGGYAVGLHGFPRYTGDIDILVAISEENAEKILDVFDSFGFGEIGLRGEDFYKKNLWWKSVENLARSKFLQESMVSISRNVTEEKLM